MGLSALLLLPAFCLLSFAVAASGPLPDPANFLVFGPGLDGRRTLPVRYLFVQMRDTAGRQLDDASLPEVDSDALRLELSAAGSEDRRLRYTSEALRLGGGLYVLRYRLHETVHSDASLSVFYFGMPVAQSPYRLSGPLRDEQCNCPQMDLSGWLDYHGCRSFNYSQLEADFARFSGPAGIQMPIVAAEAAKRFDNDGAYAYCRYVIKDNELYRSCFGKHTGFTFMSDPLLLSLLRKFRAPDLDFILNLGDWPLSRLDRLPHLPILSWCGSRHTSDIVLPTYELTEATVSMMDRIYNDLMRTAHDSMRYRWPNRLSRAFFRGRDSNKRRLELVQLSMAKPDLVDARLTNMFFFQHEKSLGDIVKHVPLGDFFKYKYQVSIDGTVAAYRLPFLLAGGSPVLKQDSDYYEHFYRDLEPMKHYVPLREDLGDLEERLAWLRAHDSQAEKIGESGRQFVLNRLMPEQVLCYLGQVLERYGQLLRSPVAVSQSYEHIKQPSDSDCRCDWTGPGVRDEL
ncbi:hypothetical protein BOX15_Mlig016306g1 [Macrostomum lignano]|uniref:Glycosyl transferase CAP10 domain-containing protein n=1 Tax=Macrostomum lignano TaxID=282301 RepID=A0A267EZS8_9PLAT|nr:hypothetical protein BOX15_Mlig016306g1 [Macrostomum lignano]